MPLDHYVPQVHLRNFYSGGLDFKKMFGIRKRDCAIFPCSSKDVCRIENGSTNPYLYPSRQIEDFLETVEPGYNAAVASLIKGNFGPHDLYCIAGFAAYVSACSPTALRLGIEPHRCAVEAAAKIIDGMGEIPELPVELGGKSLSELIDDGSVNAKVDPKYPQAIGINQIVLKLSLWANSNWDFIFNKIEDSPFFTSDFPCAVEQSHDLRILNRLVPLTPYFAVRICPNFDAKSSLGDLSFPRFRYRKLTPNRSEIGKINRSIVRCAEELVFSCGNAKWTGPFVRRNSDYWVEAVHDEIPFSDAATMHINRMRVTKRER